MNFDGWVTVDFPQGTGVVYVFYAVEGGRQFPFYVGETGSLVCRMADHFRASFTCPTDFNVGNAVKYLRDQKGYEVKVKFGRSFDQKPERLKDEDKIKQELISKKWLLLNGELGYDLKTQTQDAQLQLVKNLCDKIIRNSETISE